MKKNFLILLICFTIISCGKKGDPEYKNSQNTNKIHEKELNLIL
jgi:predicted small lipoprotein YifL